MGTSKRYAAAVDRQMDQRILARTIAEAGPLQSLTADELRLDAEPVTIDPQPKPARAWLRFGATPLLVDVEVCRWTADACAVRFHLDQKEYRAWVWSSALRPPRGVSATASIASR